MKNRNIAVYMHFVKHSIVIRYMSWNSGVPNADVLVGVGHIMISSIQHTAIHNSNDAPTSTRILIAVRRRFLEETDN